LPFETSRARLLELSVVFALALVALYVTASESWWFFEAMFLLGVLFGFISRRMLIMLVPTAVFFGRAVVQLIQDALSSETYGSDTTTLGVFVYAAAFAASPVFGCYVGVQIARVYQARPRQ
jgi:hypothetical protein